MPVDTIKILFSLGILLAAGTLVALIGLWIHRRIVGQPESSQGFTIANLRRMREEGQLTSEEYERAKATVIGVLPIDAELEMHKPNGPDNKCPTRTSDEKMATEGLGGPPQPDPDSSR